MRKHSASAFWIVLLLALLAGCTTPAVTVKLSALPTSPAKVIPAKVVIAPLQVVTATIELPAAGQQNVALNLSKTASKTVETYVKGKGVFSGVVGIRDDALPSSPSIGELAQAGAQAEADLVIQVKVVEFEGRPQYGFRPSLAESAVVELTAYETATGARRWHRMERVNAERSAPIQAWSEERMKAEFLSMAAEEIIVAAVETLLFKLQEDMAGYKPPVAEKAVAAAGEFVVDVDRVPRVSVEVKKNAFAVVVGIEAYRDLPQAEFAVRDAKMMKEYLVRVMGFPQENIVTLLNERATKGDLEGYLGTWLKNNVERGSTVFVFYAGHGAPNPVTGEAFIIPFDGNPAFPEATAFPLKKLYQMLGELQVKDILVVMDSCFSGAGGRSVMAKGGRPMAITVEDPVLATKNMVVMAAATGTQISSSYQEKRHGLFTYFFLKGLQGEADINGDGVVSLAELYDYLTPHVKKIARDQNREQTPVLTPGVELLGPRATSALARVNR